MCLVLIILALAVVFSFYVVFAIVGSFVVFLPWIVIGLVAGAIASAVTASRHGVLGDILIGLAGSVVGGALFALVLHRAVGGVFSLDHLVAAIVGSVILLLVVKALRPAY